MQVNFSYANDMKEVPASELSDDAIAIRFSPRAPEAIVKKAVRQHALVGVYSVSIFAQEVFHSDREAVRSLLGDSTSAGVDPDRNPDFFVCARIGELRARGFEIIKVEFEGEHPKHYGVDIGQPPTVQSAGLFIEVFEKERRDDYDNH